MEPTIGRLVHYRLSEPDAEAINRRRHDFKTQSHGATPPTGYVGHMGNIAKEGDVYPALIVRVFEETKADNPAEPANLQVFLDGSDTLWVTSRHEGDALGEWSWPVYAAAGKDCAAAAA